MLLILINLSQKYIYKTHTHKHANPLLPPQINLQITVVLRGGVVGIPQFPIFRVKLCPIPTQFIVNICRISLKELLFILHTHTQIKVTTTTTTTTPVTIIPQLPPPLLQSPHLLYTTTTTD